MRVRQAQKRATEVTLLNALPNYSLVAPPYFSRSLIHLMVAPGKSPDVGSSWHLTGDMIREAFLPQLHLICRSSFTNFSVMCPFGHLKSCSRIIFLQHTPYSIFQVEDAL